MIIWCLEFDKVITVRDTCLGESSEWERADLFPKNKFDSVRSNIRNLELTYDFICDRFEHGDTIFIVTRNPNKAHVETYLNILLGGEPLRKKVIKDIHCRSNEIIDKPGKNGHIEEVFIKNNLPWPPSHLESIVLVDDDKDNCIYARNAGFTPVYVNATNDYQEALCLISALGVEYVETIVKANEIKVQPNYRFYEERVMKDSLKACATPKLDNLVISTEREIPRARNYNSAESYDSYQNEVIKTSCLLELNEPALSTEMDIDISDEKCVHLISAKKYLKENVITQNIIWCWDFDKTITIRHTCSGDESKWERADLFPQDKLDKLHKNIKNPQWLADFFRVCHEAGDKIFIVTRNPNKAHVETYLNILLGGEEQRKEIINDVYCRLEELEDKPGKNGHIEEVFEQNKLPWPPSEPKSIVLVDDDTSNCNYAEEIGLGAVKVDETDSYLEILIKIFIDRIFKITEKMIIKHALYYKPFIKVEKREEDIKRDYDTSDVVPPVAVRTFRNAEQNYNHVNRDFPSYKKNTFQYVGRGARVDVTNSFFNQNIYQPRAIENDKVEKPRDDFFEAFFNHATNQKNPKQYK